MVTSILGRRFIAKNEWVPRSARCGWNAEKRRYFPYKDYAGFWTFGIGHLIVGDEDFSTGRTEEEVDELFARDLQKYENAISLNVKVPLQQNEFDALVDFCFNEGTGAVVEFAHDGSVHNSAIHALNTEHRVDVPRLLLLWCKSAGKYDPNLLHRRQAEGYLFMHSYEPAPTPVVVPVAPVVAPVVSSPPKNADPLTPDPPISKLSYISLINFFSSFFYKKEITKS